MFLGEIAVQKYVEQLISVLQSMIVYNSPTRMNLKDGIIGNIKCESKVTSTLSKLAVALFM